MADPFAPVVPALSDLLNEAKHCHCQPGRDEFVAIPAYGTYLVQDGRAATVPEPTPVMPLDDLVGQFVRDVYRHAAQTLVDNPHAAAVDVVLTTDGPDGPRELMTQTFARAPQEATHG